MKILNKAVTTLAGVAAVSAAMITDAQAVPSFARQTGMACVSCHANNFPALNAFGRAFLSSGYTMRGAAPLVEGEDLSLPADLKMSLVSKIRYQVNSSDDRGELQWPDEAAFLVGGRVSENIGFLSEIALASQAVATEGHVTACTDPTDPTTCTVESEGETEGGNFLSYKVHYNITPEFAVIMSGTDALGIGYGYELMNTGLKRSQRPIEERRTMSAFHRTHSRDGYGSGAATALTFAYHTNDWAVSYAQWVPHYGNANVNLLGGLSHYVRANYFMNYEGWDMGFGAMWTGGATKVGAKDPASEIYVAGSGIDFQAMGDLGDMPAEFYFSYAALPASTASDVNKKNSSTNDTSAYSLLGKIGVAPRTSAYLAYGSTDEGTSPSLDLSEVTVGVQYMLAQNVKLELFQTNYSSDNNRDDYTMLNVFSAF